MLFSGETSHFCNFADVIISDASPMSALPRNLLIRTQPGLNQGIRPTHLFENLHLHGIWT